MAEGFCVIGVLGFGAEWVCDVRLWAGGRADSAGTCGVVGDLSGIQPCVLLRSFVKSRLSGWFMGV